MRDVPGIVCIPAGVIDRNVPGCTGGNIAETALIQSSEKKIFRWKKGSGVSMLSGIGDSESALQSGFPLTILQIGGMLSPLKFSGFCRSGPNTGGKRDNPFLRSCPDEP